VPKPKTMSAIYSTPKLSKNATSWYVSFNYNGKRYRYKHEINRIKDLVQREYEFNTLIEFLKSQLKNGWSLEIPEIVTQKRDFYFIDALRFALEKKKDNIAPKSYSGYHGTVNFMEVSVNDLRLTSLKVADAKRVYLKLNILFNITYVLINRTHY
jgi:hypothetical protein